MRIAIATDAWFPQVNGVVRTLAATVAELDRRGYEVELITPQNFATMPMPGYASIRLAMAPRFTTRRMLKKFKPDIVHIATEGPIGWSARGWCRSHKIPFTSAFHTQFPKYAAVRTGLSEDVFWPVMRRFHKSSRAVLAATQSLEQELRQRGIAQVRPWGRGVDHWLFSPIGELHPRIANLPRPILLNVGRVAPEKNLEAFLDANLPGSKVIVGDGPDIDRLRALYPETYFMGAMAGEELAAAYRTADCFVFPSLTDTFGLVVIEALSSGVPVAAYPVQGPIDILGPNGRGASDEMPATVGVCDVDLGQAVLKALTLDRSAAAVFGQQFSWERATDQFITAIQDALAEAALMSTYELAPV
ncbi:glycosyltransferase family 1 protein [Novosphingobium sp. APW14]|uniref:glycosyltransferase family 4 protein n=1 Tax=Novosphingobium sp. APW14 TaxID=3077237 RepID=UPI0028DEBAF2|nr:glycosyltransferase family 1 protein [Novosphingobium sp. APW14]MDT9012609.1 glycosyltransferase family 1 protein [Novosphingobium sp. APW14]